jgi:hypothetical protein
MVMAVALAMHILYLSFCQCKEKLLLAHEYEVAPTAVRLIQTDILFTYGKGGQPRTVTK